MKREPRALDPLNLALDAAAPLSLQHQLRQKLVDAIHRDVLRPGQRLPSSRQLAERIGVSRNTVSLAYDALLAEGYLASRSRSGVYVAADAAGTRIGAGRPRQEPESPLAARLTPVADDAGFRCPQHWHRYPFPFIDGRVDAELTPAPEWGEAIRLASARREVLQWHQDGGDSDDALLVEEVRGKILPMRGIQAATDEVLMTASGGHALQLAGDLLIRRGTPVVLERPTDAAFERRLRERHAEVSMLDPDLREPLPPGAVVVTSCRYGFAAGSAYPGRLLARVAAADGLVIEHDVPAGVQDGGRIAPALRAFDQEGRVVYVGGLAPAVSCGEPPGVLVAAAAFIERARQLRRSQGTAPPRLMQRAWAYFIGLGHYSAGLVRAGRVMAERRTALRDALNHYLHGRVRIETSPGASAYWVSVPAGMDARELARQAAAIGVLVEPSCRGDGREALCMGVTGIGAARIREGVRNLARLVRGDLSPSSRRMEDESIAPLQGKALRRAMAGATLLYSTVYGVPCTLEIHADGNLVGTAGYAGEDCDRGHWWLEGDRWYRQWRQWAYGEASGYAVIVDGDQIRLYGEDGFLADTAVMTRRTTARRRE
ncbi:PLP-dependent aminotransferase family protein [Tahibacter sp. UC22_41]|uniref:aminotransferase-like domain-containing protein n=1 Tax=Tahibacter sp. UC22_41 TaxID=3350178 RepID=UPI0036D7C094